MWHWPAWQGWRILVAWGRPSVWGGGEHAEAQEVGAYLPVYLSPGAVRGTIGADRSGHGQLCVENSVTPLSASQVEPATADVEAEGPDEPDLRAGRRKGLCCTEGRPAKRL